MYRPASVVKELLENSLDAGATNVQICIEEGGLASIQVKDNGCGIMVASNITFAILVSLLSQEKDMLILCQRHTTSKLRQVADLKRLQTYGFAIYSLKFYILLIVVSDFEAKRWPA